MFNEACLLMTPYKPTITPIEEKEFYTFKLERFQFLFLSASSRFREGPFFLALSHTDHHNSGVQVYMSTKSQRPSEKHCATKLYATHPKATLMQLVPDQKCFTTESVYIGIYCVASSLTLKLCISFAVKTCYKQLLEKLSGAPVRKSLSFSKLVKVLKETHVAKKKVLRSPSDVKEVVNGHINQIMESDLFEEEFFHKIHMIKQSNMNLRTMKMKQLSEKLEKGKMTKEKITSYFSQGKKTRKSIQEIKREQIKKNKAQLDRQSMQRKEAIVEKQVLMQKYRMMLLGRIVQDRQCQKRLKVWISMSLAQRVLKYAFQTYITQYTQIIIKRQILWLTIKLSMRIMAKLKRRGPLQERFRSTIRQSLSFVTSPHTLHYIEQ